MVDLLSPLLAANRTCESCGGAVPHRQSRQRNAKGELVCDSCKQNPQAGWTTTHGSLSVLDQSEMRRREAEAIASVVRVRRAKHAGMSVVAHDSGDSATIHHCPFCGSGAVVGGSDGTVTCDFCHTPFTVQVQPAHPFMPQTIDGNPVVPPGMPGGTTEPSEMSAPTDPAVEETTDDVAADPLGDADPSQQMGTNGPVAPGQPPSKQPPAKPKPPGGDKPKKSLPPWMKNKASKQADDYGPVYDPETIPPGWGAHIGNGEWVTKCPQEGCGDLIPGNLPVDIQNHLWDKHQVTAPLLPGGDKRAARTVTADAIDDLAAKDWEVYTRAVTRLARHHGITYAEAEERFASRLVHPEGAQKNLVTGESVRALLAFRTTEGRTLPVSDYMARLALDFADDREAVLDAVRMNHMAASNAHSEAEIEAHGNCPKCKGEGDTSNGVECDRCHGTGVVKIAADLLNDDDVYTADDLLAREPFGHGDLLNPQDDEREDYSTDLLADNGHILGPEYRNVRRRHLVDEHGFGHSGSRHPFEAAGAKALVKHEVLAEDVQEGDFLDIMGKTRIAQIHPNKSAKVMCKTQTRGARSPSVQDFALGSTVTVWRRA